MLSIKSFNKQICVYISVLNRPKSRKLGINLTQTTKNNANDIKINI